MLREIKIGIVLPLFKHSVYVQEAILSALDQQIEEDYIIAIVNDGCPHKETDEVCKLYASTYTEKIFYIRKSNGGLSSARNVGIDFVLQRFPSVEAIYLLDADNRIYPFALQNAWQTLQEAPDHIGWAYPNIDMFTTDYNLATGGEFSVLKMLSQNYCEAGSMIRREVFENGVRYDEEMLLGYEDWELWYQAIEKGFRGKHVPNLGFQYRKRPESMLANSTEDDMQIRGYMRRKHKSLFSIEYLLRREEEEAPRYSLVFDDGEINYFVDPARFSSTSLPIRQHHHNFFQAQFFPYLNHIPPICAFATKGGWSLLRRYRLLNWLFWKIDNMFSWMSGMVAVKILKDTKNRVAIDLKHDIKQYQHIRTSDLIFIKSDLLFNIIKDDSDAWFKTLFSENIQPKVNLLEISIPEEYMDDNDFLLNDFKLHVENLKLEYQKIQSACQLTNSEWRAEDLIPINMLNSIPKRLTKLQSIYPLLQEKTKIGFILSLSSFGGVEKVTHNLSKALKRRGYSVHLFIFGANEYTLFDEFADTYDSINFLIDDDIGHWQKEKSYFGVGTTSWHDNHDKRQRAIGMLSGMNIVVNQHSVDALAIMGKLKRIGIKTIDYLHLFDKTIYDEDTGYVLSDIVYEHGFDKYIVISKKLQSFLHGMGIPKEKIVVVPNAPSYEIPDARLIKYQEKKLKRQNKKLRILYIGRLDRQKGLERLQKIYTMTQKMEVEWRVVGKSILTEDGDHNDCNICSVAEDPVFDNHSLTELYMWADCVVMPSYNEGVPLVMLEAMRLGATPICSDVGAIDEVIVHEENGFIFPNKTRRLILDFTQTIFELSGDIEERKRIQKEAMRRSSEYSWDLSAEIFIKNIYNKETK